MLFPSSVSLIAQGSLTSAKPGCASYDSHINIINITCNTNLSQINQIINNRMVLEKDPNGIWILKTSIKVNPLAKITINQSDTSWLKITNKNDKQPNFILISGNAKIDNVKISSLNPNLNNTIKENATGFVPRPYILVYKPAGILNISNSEISFLGYNSYP